MRRSGGSVPTSGRVRWMLGAVAAAGALVASACGRPVPAPGDVSPVKGLVSSLPAATKPVSSMVWATTRDVISLDPIHAAAFPEYTADSLMCESLLRQAPGGALEPGLATVSNPSPTTMVFTLRPGVRFWDGHPVTSADVVYSLDRQIESPAGRVQCGGLQQGGLGHRDQPVPGDDQAQTAGLLAGRRTRLDTRHRHREELRRKTGQELRHPGRIDHVHGCVHVQVVDAGRGRDGGPQPALLEPLGPPACRPDHP